MSSTTDHRIAMLFEAPHAIRWLPAFAAAAIGDPVAGEALAPFIGPATEKVGGSQRARVPGEEHFARTWAVIKPGFQGRGAQNYAAHTRSDHLRTRIPGDLIALPVQWIEVMLANVLNDYGRNALILHMRTAAHRFGLDISADPAVVDLPLDRATPALARYFARVNVPEEPGRAFWRAMDFGPVRTDLGGARGRVDVAAIEWALKRHLPRRFADQYMQYRPA